MFELLQIVAATWIVITVSVYLMLLLGRSNDVTFLEFAYTPPLVGAMLTGLMIVIVAALMAFFWAISVLAA